MEYVRLGFEYSWSSVRCIEHIVHPFWEDVKEYCRSMERSQGRSKGG